MSEHSNHDFLELTRQIEQTLEFDENNYAILSSSRSEASRSDTLRPCYQPADFEWNTHSQNEISDLPPGLNLKRNENHFQHDFYDESPYSQRYQQENWEDNPGITEIKLNNIQHEVKTSRFQKHFQAPADHSRLKLTSDLFVPVGILVNTIPLKNEEGQNNFAQEPLVEKLAEQQIENKTLDHERVYFENNNEADQKEEEIPKIKDTQQPNEYKILSKKEIEARKKLKEAGKQKEVETLKPRQKQVPKIDESTPKRIEIKKEIHLNQEEGKNFTNSKHERKYSGTKKGKKYIRTEIDSQNNDQYKKQYQNQISKKNFAEKDNAREQRKSILFQEGNKEGFQRKNKQGKIENEESVHKNNPYGRLAISGDFESSSSESKDSAGQSIEDKISENIQASNKDLTYEKENLQNESLQKTKKKKNKSGNKQTEEIDKEENIEKHIKEIEEIKKEAQEEQIEKEESSEEEKLINVVEQGNSKSARNKKKRAAKKRNKKVNTLEELEEKIVNDQEEQENKKEVSEEQTEIEEYTLFFPEVDLYNDLILSAKVSKLTKKKT